MIRFPTSRFALPHLVPVGLALLTAGCAVGPRLTTETALKQGHALASEPLPEPCESLKPHFSLKRAPGPTDWLTRRPEPVQSVEMFAQRSRPARTPALHRIDLLPIGRLTPAETQLLNQTGSFLSAFLGAEIRMLNAVSPHDIPEAARRQTSTATHAARLNSPAVLRHCIEPRLRDSQSVILGVTARDLAPARGDGFLYGQASLGNRVALVSLHRQHVAGNTDDAHRRTLSRVTRSAAHEICHAIGLAHCTSYECLMNGAFNRNEADDRPAFLCPVCLYKLSLRLPIAPDKHYQALRRFYLAHGMDQEAKQAQSLRDIVR